MKSLERYQTAFLLLYDGMTASVTAKELDDVRLEIKDGALQDSRAFTQTNTQVTVEVGGHLGRVVSERDDDDPMALINEAAQNARFVDGEGKIEREGRMCVPTCEDDKTVDDLLALGIALERAALALDGVEKVNYCSVRRRIMRYHTVSSLGEDNLFNETMYEMRLDLKSANGTAGHAVTAQRMDELDVSAFAASVLRDAERSHADLPLVGLEDGVSRVIIGSGTAACMMTIAWMGMNGGVAGGRSMASPLRADAVLCYEPTTPVTWADGAHPVPPVEEYPDGVLSIPLNRTTDLHMCSKPTAIYIEKGKNSLEDLIQQLSDGILVTAATDVVHSVEPANGVFSLMCDGLIYRGGQPVARFEHGVLAGDMQQMLRDVTAAADDFEMMEFMNPNYGYGSPSLLVRELRTVGRS